MVALSRASADNRLTRSAKGERYTTRQVAFYTKNQHSWVTLPAGTMPFETEPTETEVLALMEQLRGS
jgi:hypothetical protein